MTSAYLVTLCETHTRGYVTYTYCLLQHETKQGFDTTLFRSKKL